MSDVSGGDAIFRLGLEIDPAGGEAGLAQLAATGKAQAEELAATGTTSESFDAGAAEVYAQMAALKERIDAIWATAPPVMEIPPGDYAAAEAAERSFAQFVVDSREAVNAEIAAMAEGLNLPAAQVVKGVQVAEPVTPLQASAYPQGFNLSAAIRESDFASQESRIRSQVNQLAPTPVASTASANIAAAQAAQAAQVDALEGDAKSLAEDAISRAQLKAATDKLLAQSEEYSSTYAESIASQRESAAATRAQIDQQLAASDSYAANLALSAEAQAQIRATQETLQAESATYAQNLAVETAAIAKSTAAKEEALAADTEYAKSVVAATTAIAEQKIQQVAVATTGQVATQGAAQGATTLQNAERDAAASQVLADNKEAYASSLETATVNQALVKAETDRLLAASDTYAEALESIAASTVEQKAKVVALQSQDAANIDNAAALQANTALLQNKTRIAELQVASSEENLAVTAQLKVDQINYSRALRSATADAFAENGQYGKSLLTRVGAIGNSGPGGSLGSTGPMGMFRSAVPLVAAYAGFETVKDSVDEYNKLSVVLSQIDNQMKQAGEGSSFPQVKQQIMDVAAQTGIASDQVAKLQQQFQAAFQNQSIGGLSGTDLASSFTSATSKLQVIGGGSLQDLGSQNTAVTEAFGTSASTIADTYTTLRNTLGVDIPDISEAMGELGPVAIQAGYQGQQGFDQLATSIAITEQKTSKSATSIADAYQRIITGFPAKAQQLLADAETVPQLANPQFLSAVSSGNVKDVLTQLASVYSQLTDAQKTTIATDIGGRRETEGILPLFQNASEQSDILGKVKDGTGAADKAFKDLQGTFTQTWKEFKENLTQITVYLLNSGLIQGFEAIAQVLKLIVAGVNDTLQPLEALSPSVTKWVSGLAEGYGLLVLISKFGPLSATISGSPLSHLPGIGAKSGTSAAEDESGAAKAASTTTEAAAEAGRVTTSAAETAANTTIDAATVSAEKITASAETLAASATETAGGEAGGAAGGAAVAADVTAASPALAIQAAANAAAETEKNAAISAAATTTAATEENDALQKVALDERVAEMEAATGKNVTTLAEAVSGFADEVEAAGAAFAAETAAAGGVDAAEQTGGGVLAGAKNLLGSAGAVLPYIGIAALGAAAVNHVAQEQTASYDTKLNNVSQASVQNQTPAQLQAQIQSLKNTSDNQNVIAKTYDHALGLIIGHSTQTPAEAQAQHEQDYNATHTPVILPPGLTIQQGEDLNAKNLKPSQDYVDNLRNVGGAGLNDQLNGLALSNNNPSFSALYESVLENNPGIADKNKPGNIDVLKLQQLAQSGNAQAIALIDFMASVFGGDGPNSLGGVFKAAKNLQTNLGVATNTITQTKQLTQSYQGGDISGAQYQAGLESNVANLKSDLAKIRVLNPNANTAPIEQQIAEANKALNAQLLTNAEDQLKNAQNIEKASGGSDTASLQSAVQQFSALVDSGKLTSSKDIQKAVTDIFSAEQELYQNALDNATTLGQKLAIEKNGIPIDPSAQIAILIAELNDNTNFAQFLEQYSLDVNTVVQSFVTNLAAQLKMGQETLGEVAKKIALARVNIFNPKLSQGLQGFDIKDLSQLPGVLGTVTPAPTAYRGSTQAQQNQTSDQNAKSQEDLAEAYANQLKASQPNNPDVQRQAALEIANAQLKYAAQETDRQQANIDAINANTAIITANLDYRKSQEQLQDAQASILTAQVGNNGLQKASIDIASAQRHLNNATADGDPVAQAQAQAEMINARKSYQQATEQLEDAYSGIFKAQAGDDRVKSGQYAIDDASRHFQNAITDNDPVAKLQAQADIVKAQYDQFKNAQAIFDDVFDYLAATDTAKGDKLGAAQEAVKKAQFDLAEAQTEFNQGQIDIGQLDKVKGAYATALANQTSTQIDVGKSAADFAYQMGQETRGQYIAQLQSLLTIQGITQDQTQQILLTIHQLQNQANQDAQFDIPSLVGLPTLYEAQRLQQAGNAGYGEKGSASIGYQDNKVVTINVNGGNTQAVLKTVSQALGGSSSQFGDTGKLY